MPALKNPKWEWFCQEVLVDDNGTKAYIRAGYSSRGAEAGASRLSANVKVAARLAELRLERSKRTATTADWVIGQLEQIARADIRKFFKEDGTLKNIHELDDDEAAALSAFEFLEVGGNGGLRFATKIKRWDRPKVLEMLGKHHGLWTNKAGDRIADSLEEMLRRSYLPKEG